MKKTRLTLAALLLSAVMALGIATGCGDKTPPEYKPEGPGTDTPIGDSITLDGKLDEALYTNGTLKWMDYTTTGTGDEGLATTAVNVKATSAYGKDGFYLAFDVSHTPVYVDLAHTRPSYYDSCIEAYLGFPNIDPIEHSYQIDIAPDGHINVQKHNGNYFMDFYLTDGQCAATVKGGEINTTAANGYVLEAYFPWSMFGFDEALACIQMDPAVIVSSRQDANGRDGWDSLGLDHKPDCSWGVPSTYWHWGSNGFEDSDLILSIADYDTAKGNVSFGKTAYKAYEDVVINVAPTAGNILQSVKINGQDCTSQLDGGKLTLPAYAGKQKIEVAAAFITRPADMVTVSGSVTQTAGNGLMDVEDKTIVFTSAAGTYTAKVQDGKYSVDILKGTYAASFAGCADATVEIDGAATDKNISFRYNLFGEDTVNTISQDQATVVTGTEWVDTVVNAGENFVFDYTVKFKDGVTVGTGDDNLAFGYYTEANKHYIFDHYYMAGGWDSLAIRDIDNFWGGTIGDPKGYMGGSFASYVEGVPFRLIRVDDTFYWYIKQGDNYTLMQKHAALGKVTKITMTIWGSNNNDTSTIVFDLVNITYSDVMPEVTVESTTNDAAMGTVTAPAKSRFGVPTNVTFAPAEGYILGRVTVNGVDKTADVKNNTLVFIPEDYACTVAASFISESEQAFTVSGTLTATAGKSQPWIVPEGTQVEFAGVTSETTTVGKNGAYSVDLKAGTYTVTAAGYKPVSVTVTEETTLDKQLVYDLIADNSDAQVSADESSVLPNGDWRVGEVNIPSVDQWVFTVTMKGGDGSWKNTIQLYDQDNQYHDIGFHNTDDGLKVGVGAAGNADWIADNGHVLTNEEVTLDWSAGYNVAIVRDGDIIMAYIEYKDGKYHPIGHMVTSSLLKFHLQFQSTDNSYHNISMSLGVNELDKAISEVTVQGTMKATAGASEAWNVPENTVVTLSRAGMADTNVTVGADGAFTVTLPCGKYAASATGYAGYIYVTDANAVGQLVYDLIQDRNESEVSEDETTVKSAAWAAVSVNVPTGDTWVFTCTMKTASGDATWKHVMQLYDGSQYIDFGLMNSDEGQRVGVGAPNNADSIKTSGILLTDADVDFDWANGWDFAIVRNGDTFQAYLRYKDGKYHAVGTATIADFRQFHLQFPDGGNEWHNLSLTLGTTELADVYVAPQD